MYVHAYESLYLCTQLHSMHVKIHCFFFYSQSQWIHICLHFSYSFVLLQSITVGNGPLEQPLVYEMYYNGTRENVTSPTTTLTFTAPSLPDRVFMDKIIVTVTAINRFGRGTPSDCDYDEISELCICDRICQKGLICAITNI